MAGILLLGPDRETVADIRGLLREDGHEVTAVRSVDVWCQVERKAMPDLIVAPADVAERVLSAHGQTQRGFPAPLLFVQRDSGLENRSGLDDRLVDHISSPFMREEFLARVDALVRVRQVVLRQPVGQPAPDKSATGRSGRGLRGLRAKIGAALNSRIPPYEKPLAPYLEVAARLAEWADQRDAFEPGHAERVASFCAMMASGLGMDDERTAALLRAAMLHDIGKVALPVEVLHQKTPLEETQMRLIRTHPRRGAALLRALDSDDQVADTILYHHECPNGSGYYGQLADGTPLTARILAVAEVYDAMTSSQVKQPLPRDRALDQIQSSKGDTLDGDCVEALVDGMRPRSSIIPLAAPRRS